MDRGWNAIIGMSIHLYSYVVSRGRRRSRPAECCHSVKKAMRYRISKLIRRTRILPYRTSNSTAAPRSCCLADKITARQLQVSHKIYKLRDDKANLLTPVQRIHGSEVTKQSAARFAYVKLIIDLVLRSVRGSISPCEASYRFGTRKAPAKSTCRRMVVHSGLCMVGVQLRSKVFPNAMDGPSHDPIIVPPALASKLRPQSLVLPC